jgi:superfamily II DNA/RNA helicase
MTTPFHAKYFAYDLTRSGGDGVDRLTQSLFNASVDLNPHQVEAALFAIRSPLSKGVLLADEVGLGKTIEAGLVLCQYWAERKKKLLVVCPASLRKQWQIELEEKFNLPAIAVDSRLFKKAEKEGLNVFNQDKVIIVSYHYAARMAEQLRLIQWDMAVIDEAHKLRNSYRASNKMGQGIRWALEDRRKLLLTATPLQNSLTELYGIATLIDDEMFGDLPTFRTLYSNADGDLDDLRSRINGFCLRTLRQDVQEFIRYTKRQLTTIKFRPTDDEHKLYESVSEFLQKPDSYAFPQRQRHLTIVVVRKVLASSPIALAYTLEVILERLKGMRDNAEDTTDITSKLLSQDEIGEDLLDELLDEIELEGDGADQPEGEEEKVDLAKLESEIVEVEHYIRWARSIGIDTKTRHLLKALTIGYEKLKDMGAAEKALVFTESRRTQTHLKDFLEANGYAGQVVTFSGTNNSPEATEIYKNWVAANQDSGKISGSKPIDMRHALVDHFESSAKIMIATEAASEGINLQFCSLLINFDLPWNPQRIEQRIGRVHRYGQKHDVVVVNFLNERNAADERVYELLQHKFKLFDGVFGASDDVLGQLDSSGGLEKRILDLYQQCRSPQEIDTGFKQLQNDLEKQIQTRMVETRQKLLEHFDEDVHSRIKVDYDDAMQALDSVGRRFWRLTKFVLGGLANFSDDNLTFRLTETPVETAQLGTYTLNRKRNYRERNQESITDDIDNQFLYRFSHPLGEFCIDCGQSLTPSTAKVVFDLSGYSAKVSAVEPLVKKSGWLMLSRLVIQSLDVQDYLLFSGFADDGAQIEHEVFEQLFKLDGRVVDELSVPEEVSTRLTNDSKQFASATTRKCLEENNNHFQERRMQLYRWADDVVAAAERNLSQVKTEVRAANRAAALATTVEEQTQAQETIRELEKRKRSARKKIFETEDEIENKRDLLIEALQKKLVQDVDTQTLFALRWEVA